VSGGPVLLTGASGFVGRHALQALRGRTSLRLLVHQRPLDSSLPDGSEVVAGDLGDPASLARICRGIRSIVHLAGYIGEDPRKCEQVNAHGTRLLVTAAREAGVERVIYLSNAAVYGYAVHRGVGEADAVVAPATPISRSRVAAEHAVLAARGSVLRPLFVYGEGDSRFVPAIARALRTLPFLINQGRASLSVIAVGDLARCIAALAIAENVGAEPAVFHATDGHPVTFLEIVRLVANCAGLIVPRVSLPYLVGRPLLRLARLGRRWTASDAHRLFLVSHDHFYDSSRLRAATGLPQPAPMSVQFEASAEWYRKSINEERTG